MDLNDFATPDIHHRDLRVVGLSSVCDRLFDHWDIWRLAMVSNSLEQLKKA